MASRRDFLAAVGAGALLPSVSQAWGRHRRRCGCQTCGGEDCQGCGGEMSVGPRMYTTPCANACPIACYGNVNGVWYYYCLCCPRGYSYVNASYDQYLDVPQGCSSANTPGLCIPTGSFSRYLVSGEKKRVYTASKLPKPKDDRDFLPFNDHYTKGIDGADDPPMVTWNEHVVPTDPIKAQYNQYNDPSQPIYAAFLEAEIPVLGKLHIGLQYKDQPTMGVNTTRFRWQSTRGHYDIVRDQDQGYYYHVLTKKS